MVLISTLFEAANVDFIYVIRPKPKPGQDSQDQRLMRHHISAAGNESLIFNPRASLKIRSRIPAIRTEVSIPISMVRRFINVLSSMDTLILDANMFREEDGDVVVNGAVSMRNAKKMTVHRDTIVLMPAVALCYGKKERGVSISVNGEILGAISYSECISLADVVQNFDPQTYELIAGMNDEVNRIDRKLDLVYDAVMRIEGMLTSSNGQRRQGYAADDFGWQSLNNGGMRNY